MATTLVVSQMQFRNALDAGEYQDQLFDDTGFEAQVKRTDSGFSVITVVEVKNKSEAEAVQAFLQEFEYEGRKPTVSISSRGGRRLAAPEPEEEEEDEDEVDVSDVIDVDRISEARKRYDATPKAQEYRRQFRQSQAFKASQQRYQQSEAGRAAQRRYSQSDQGKTARQAYQQSEKGKAARKAYQERRRQQILELRQKGLL